jgi:hypothetical protein
MSLPTTPSDKGKSVPLLRPCQLPLFLFTEYDRVFPAEVEDGEVPEPRGSDFNYNWSLRAWVRDARLCKPA